MTNNSACWYLFPGAKTRRRPWPHNRLRFFLEPTTATDTRGLGIDVYNLLGSVSSGFSYASEIRITARVFFFFPAQKTWRIRIGAAHGIFSPLREGFGMDLSVLQRWVPVWPVLVRS